VYLWHWPIFLTLSEARVGIGGYALFAVRVAVTLATASLSYYSIEMPIRRGELKTKVLLRLAPAAFVSVALVLVLATAGAPAPQVEVSASDLHAPKVEVKDATVQRDPPRVLLVGDSLANSLAPGFQRLADQQGWVLWNASVPGCGLADEGEYWIGIWQNQSDKCKPEWRQRWPAHIATFDPDVVVVLLGGHDTTDRL